MGTGPDFRVDDSADPAGADDSAGVRVGDLERTGLPL
jgi:hypothetical protein